MPRLSGDRRHRVGFTLNGRPVAGEAEPRMLLTDFLRHVLGRTGTNVGCEHGVCGACTVRLDGRAVRACLTLAVQAHGRSVETVEGLGGTEGELNALQAAFKRNFALQCGYCTPGILMSLAEYLDNGGAAEEEPIRDLLSGHLCRCTGYAPIVRAAVEAARERKAMEREG